MALETLFAENTLVAWNFFAVEMLLIMEIVCSLGMVCKIYFSFQSISRYLRGVSP